MCASSTKETSLPANAATAAIWFHASACTAGHRQDGYPGTSSAAPFHLSAPKSGPVLRLRSQQLKRASKLWAEPGELHPSPPDRNNPAMLADTLPSPSPESPSQASTPQRPFPVGW